MFQESKKREADQSEKQTEPRRTTGKLDVKGPSPAQHWNGDHCCPLPEANIIMRERERNRGSQNQAAQLHRAIARRSALAPHPIQQFGPCARPGDTPPLISSSGVLAQAFSRIQKRCIKGLVNRRDRPLLGCRFCWGNYGMRFVWVRYSRITGAWI